MTSQPCMLRFVSYTQTGALTRISSKLIIAPSSLLHTDLIKVYTTTYSGKPQAGAHRVTSRINAMGATRNNRKNDRTWPDPAIKVMSDLFSNGAMSNRWRDGQ